MTSNSRKLASQLCAIFPYIYLHLSYGVFAGYVVILIAELHKKDSEISTTLDQLTWFAGLEIIKPICTFGTGLLMHRWGCRPIAFMASLLYIASGLMYYYSTTATIIFVGRLLSLLFSVPSIANPYIGEISEPQLRSHLFMVVYVADAFGSFVPIVLGSLMYWRTIVLANLICPALTFVTVLLTPESPVWLASKGRFNEAKKSLCWLRGWVDPEQVQIEFDTLVESKIKSISEKKTHETEANSWQKRSKKFFDLFIQRSFYVPLGTMCLLFFLHSSNGVQTIEIYSTVVFRKIGSPIKDSVASAIMEAMGVTGSLVIFLLIGRVRSRTLIFFSVVATGLCYATVALIGFLELKGQYLYISTITTTIPRLVNTMGIAAFLFIITSEIFPPSVRYVGTSMTFSFKMIIESLIKKLFLYIVEAFTLPGVFAFFAFMNLLGLVTYYFLFPEIEDRSLGGVESHYTAVKCKQEREIANKDGYQSD